MQILVSLARYRLKLAEELDNRADIVDLSIDDLERMQAIAGLIGPTGADIGVLPGNLYEKLFDAIKEFAGKIPSSKG
jgi:hypothetical protein